MGKVSQLKRCAYQGTLRQVQGRPFGKLRTGRMPLECCLSRRWGSLLRQAQDGELAEPQPRLDWRRLRTCLRGSKPATAGEGLRYARGGERHFGNTNRGRDVPPTGFATVSKYVFGRDRPVPPGICRPDQGKLLFRSGSGAQIPAGLPPPPDRCQSQ